MKKLLLGGGIVLCLVLGGLSVYKKLNADRSAPEITFVKEITYTDKTTERDLLAGVSARDAEDGDVTDSLVVESVAVNDGDNTVIVVYAARDSKNNITKISRVLSCAEKESESETEPEEKTERAETAKSNVKQDNETETEEVSEAESESETESETESESEELAPGSPVIKLSETKATINKGGAFNPLNYVASIEDDYDNIYSLWRDIQMDGEYDVNKAGTYNLSFYVVDSSGNRSNTARFKLIVKE